MKTFHQSHSDLHTEFWLVRHGQTDWNLEGRFQGQADMPLNQTGLNQAYELAEKLKGVHFHAIYSSDLVRALQTARALANGHIIQIDRRLREVNQGEWEGMHYGTIKDLYPSQIQKRRDDPLNARPPGGESLPELARRVLECIDEIAERHPAQRVLIVSHGLTIGVVLSTAQGLPLEQAYQLIPDNAQPQLIQWRPGHRKESG